MIGLNGSLSIAESSLAVQYAGIATANNNIANANTPGYSRQIVSLSSEAYIQNGTTVDAGVAYAGTKSVRDQVLNLAITDKSSEQASLAAQSAIFQQVNSDFSSTTGGIGVDLSGFFSSLSALSTNSSNPSARQAVLTAAGRLANDFGQSAESLNAASRTADQQVVGTVAQINQLSTQIAALNASLADGGLSGQDGGALQDQRDEATAQLSQLTGVSTIQTDSTPTLTTGSGSPLVIGSTAYALQVSTGPDGNSRVIDSLGQDITSKLSSGTLGGALAIRDTTVPGLSAQLDGLAYEFGSAMNSAQISGYTEAGLPGGPMFNLPSTSAGAAQAISLSLTNGSGLALSSAASLQDTSNLSGLLAVEATALPSGATPGDTYANFVGQVGNAGAEASTRLAAVTASVNQLTTQRDRESGVSMDEETINLVRFQQAYTAAAKVISTIDGLYATVMNMASQGAG